MDLEMVFNELSVRIPADNIQTAKQRMLDLIATAREAAERGVKPIIRTHSEFYASVLANNYSLSNWLVDPNIDRDDIRFILTAARTPFLVDIQNSEIENRNILSDFLCEGETSAGLGIAYLLESVALSIRSELKWESNNIVLETTWLEDNENLNSDTVTVVHASSKEHIQSHMTWIQERIRQGVRDGLDLWKRTEELFPSLSFCENAGKHIQSLGTGNPMLRQVVKRLFELENYCKIWTDGAFSSDNIPSKASPESDSRLKQFIEELTIKCPDGEKRIFSWHLRMTGAGAWRLYFCEELGPGKIIIGYIGPKIL